MQEGAFRFERCRKDEFRMEQIDLPVWIGESGRKEVETGKETGSDEM